MQTWRMSEHSQQQVPIPNCNLNQCCVVSEIIAGVVHKLREGEYSVASLGGLCTGCMLRSVLIITCTDISTN